MAKRINANKNDKRIIAFSVPVTIKASEGEGDAKGPPTFDVVAYNGGALSIESWDVPVVIDLAGLTFSRNVVANLDHEPSQRVGHVTDKSKADGSVKLSGVFSAATPFRAEVIDSAKDGFEWEASVEVTPTKILEVETGKTVQVNGQDFSGPLYVARKGILSGFAFVSHGADPTTNVKIAAVAATTKEPKMDEKFKAWIEAMLPGTDIESLSPEAVTNLEANYKGQNGKPQKPTKPSNPFEARKLEAKRREEIRDIADKLLERREKSITEAEISAVEEMHDHAIEANMSPVEFRCEINETMLASPSTVRAPRIDNKLTGEVVEAAICVAGGLRDVEKRYSDQVLQAAHDRFKSGIGLKQVLVLAAQANGHNCNGYNVDLDVQRAAFGLPGGRGPIRANQGFSTISLPNAFANVANKFIREGWMHVDQAWREIAAIRTVTDFKQITTVSLTGDMMFEKVGADGQLKHGTLGETTYNNQVETYGKMFAITRRDIINDDLGALTAVPRRLGRGGALKLNDIFWAEFLSPSVANFWHTNHANVNTAVADMTVGGLAATEVIFRSLVDPDGEVLGTMPKILLVPTGSNAAALTLMSSERLIDGTGTAIQGDANIWRGRFKVVSSPYMSNSAYTGYSAVAWYMLADPNDIPSIEVAALFGRVEPTVDTAEAEFNSLGIQMRGYSDVGVKVQEPLSGVRADGGSS